MSKTTTENIYDHFSCLENFVIPVISILVIVFCLVNKFHLRTNYPTLYDEVVTWPVQVFKNIILTYVLFMCSVCATIIAVKLLYTYKADVVAKIKEKPRTFALWNYILIEIMLKVIDKLTFSECQIPKVILYLVWCMTFSPSLCIFEKNSLCVAFQETFLVLCTLTIVAFFWNLQVQKYIIRKFVLVLLGIYIPLTVLSILMIVFGYPNNIVGLTSIFFVLYGGLVFHVLLFVVSTHVFVHFTKLGVVNVIRNAVDFYVCAMHIFVRVMILNNYKFFIKYE